MPRYVRYTVVYTVASNPGRLKYGLVSIACVINHSMARPRPCTTTSRTKRKEETQARICSKQAQQMSISYTTLKRSERKKPKLESQHFPTSSSSPMQPCSKYTAQERSGSYYSRTKQKEETQARICSKRAAPILLSNKAKGRSQS